MAMPSHAGSFRNDNAQPNCALQSARNLMRHKDNAA